MAGNNEFENRVLQRATEKYRQQVLDERKKHNKDCDEALQKAHAEYLQQIHERRNNIKGEDGVMRNDWDDCIAAAEKLIAAHTTAYNQEWRMSFLSLVGAQYKLGIAIYNTLDENVYANVFLAIKLAGNKLLKQSENVDNLHVGTKQLPAILYHVTLTDEGKLSTELTQGSSSLHEFAPLFHVGVKKWLAEQGYTPGITEAEKDCFFDRSGKKLDKATFDALKNDEVHGFQKYLVANSELDYVPSKGP